MCTFTRRTIWAISRAERDAGGSGAGTDQHQCGARPIAKQRNSAPFCQLWRKFAVKHVVVDWNAVECERTCCVGSEWADAGMSAVLVRDDGRRYGRSRISCAGSGTGVAGAWAQVAVHWHARRNGVAVGTGGRVRH